MCLIVSSIATEFDVVIVMLLFYKVLLVPRKVFLNGYLTQIKKKIHMLYIYK